MAGGALVDLLWQDSPEDVVAIALEELAEEAEGSVLRARWLDSRDPRDGRRQLAAMRRAA